MNRFFILTLALVSAMARAESNLGLGVFQHNMNRVTTSSKGDKDLMGTRYLPVIARYKSGPVFGSLSWAPYLSFTHLTTLVMPVETPDKNAKKNFVIVASPLIYPLGQDWFVSGGPGLMYQEIKGKGGTQTLNNGTGTAVFGVPSKSSSSKVALFELGTGFNFTNWVMGFDLYFSGLASQKLSTGFQFSLAYRFGGRGW